jgi:aryl-alcohol dehydrogenase-like predicted oxidoreductase
MNTFTRELGRSGIRVSGMGLGCWAIGGPFFAGDTAVGWGEVDDDESMRAIHCGLDHGINFFDTADVYGTGHSEEVLGRALVGKRSQVVIATKFGNTFDSTTRQMTGVDASPEYIAQACEASLRRLQTDFIDLYQLHINAYSTQQVFEVREALEELVQAGKIRAYGWSTDDPDNARVFAQGAHCTAIQHDLNVIQDAPDVIAVCEASNLASINRGPLAMGLLTGKFNAASQLAANDVRGQNLDWMKYYQEGKPNPEWLAKLDAIRGVLTSSGRTLAQGALAWLWARSPQCIPIPGFRTVKQVTENSGALQFGPLTPEQMREIDQLLGRTTAAGMPAVG